jgi:hypothetical protein
MSDTAGSGFGKFVPGFEFLQNLASQATSGMTQGLGQSVPQLPNLGSWVAPTYNVEDIEKRIEELKAVHFWLDQNSKALGATIQALEVQKMTLSTLKNMNISIGDVANAIKERAAETFAGFTGGASASPPPAPAPTQFAGLEIPPRTYGTPTPPPAEAPASAPAAGVVDPMQWWGALSQQFQQIATHAMKDVAQQAAFDTTREVASGLTEQAMKTATDMADQVTRGLSDTVARHVDMATDMASDLGKAAASAASAVTPSPAAETEPEPAPEPVQPKAKKAPARRAAAKAVAPKADTPPATSGEWTMPGTFFKVPGFSLTPAAAPAKPAAARKTSTQTAAKTTTKPAAKASAKTPAKATAKAPTQAPAAAKKAAAKKPTGRGA